jgi:hypothetical protein
MADELSAAKPSPDRQRLVPGSLSRRVRLHDGRHPGLAYLAVCGLSDVVLAAWARRTSAAVTKKRLYCSR